jgi:hypothetical protein
MSVVYPLFVLLDDRTMMSIASPDLILYHLEPIDIENEEYGFWDSTGQSFRIETRGGKITEVRPCESNMSLNDAFLAYVDAMSLPRTLVDGEPTEILDRIDHELRARPKKASWLSKLFRS